MIKKSARQKALVILERLAEKTKLSEEEIEVLSVKIGKKITGRK